MNPFDALINKKTPEQRREWLEPVKRNGRDLNAYCPSDRLPRAKPEPRRPTISVDEWLLTLPPEESYLQAFPPPRQSRTNP